MFYWELYDKNLNKTNIMIKEGEDIPKTLYHYTVNTWIINSKKELLLCKNSLNPSLYYPGFWCGISGNVLKGEKPIDTCLRSIYSNIGINISKKNIKKLDTRLRDPYQYIYETYLVIEDINIDDIRYNNSNISDVKWVDMVELNNMIENGEIAYVLISRIKEYIFPLMK